MALTRRAVAPSTVHTTIVSKEKRSAAGDPRKVHVDRTRQEPVVPVDHPVGRVRVAVEAKLSLEYHSLGITLDVELPMLFAREQSPEAARAGIHRIKAMVDDELAKLLPECREALIAIKEWRE